MATSSQWSQPHSAVWGPWWREDNWGADDSAYRSQQSSIRETSNWRLIDELYEQINRLILENARLQTQIEGGERSSEEKSKRIDQLTKLLGESHSQVKNSTIGFSTNPATQEIHDPEKSAAEGCDTEIDDTAASSTLCLNAQWQKAMKMPAWGPDVALLLSLIHI